MVKKSFLFITSVENIMLQEQLFEEIKQIPSEKLTKIYDVIHYFKLGLKQEILSSRTIKQRPIGLAKDQFTVPASFFDELPDDMLNAFEDIK
jgi:hypothetical protein